MANGNKEGTPQALPDQPAKDTKEVTEFMRLSELYISDDPLLTELQDYLLAAEGGIHAFTPENSDYHTLEALVTEIDDHPVPQIKQVETLVNVGVIPLMMYNDAKGKNLVLGLKPYEDVFFDDEGKKVEKNRVQVIDKEGLTKTVQLRHLDEILINFSDTVVPYLRNQMPEFKDFRDGALQFILLHPEIFDKVSLWATNKAEREKFLNRVNEETSALESFYAIVRTAIKSKASDVHIEQPEEGKCVVRYRVDGVLRKGSDKVKKAKSLIGVVKTNANLDLAESRRPQDGSITFERRVSQAQNIADGYSLRVSTMPTLYGEKVVMRLLHTERKFRLVDIGYPEDIYHKVQQQISVPYGIILVTGPTGSGKTTTLYSILQELNTEDTNIVTIEDPIELPIHGVNQSQVMRKIDWDFGSSLRQYLRQDPDIILVGEIRDGETAKTAMEAAKTGHLVLSTLHTNDAVSSLLRLYELGVANSDLQSCLQSIVAQRLVRKLCEKCKVPYDARTELNGLLGSEVVNEPLLLYGPPAERRIPCLECSDIGYKGRLPVAEIWVLVDKERQLIYEGCKDYQGYLSSAMQNGMVPLVVAGTNLVLENKTTLHELGKHIPAEHFGKRRDLIIEAFNTKYHPPGTVEK